jgi:FK506-binding protein 2
MSCLIHCLFLSTGTGGIFPDIYRAYRSLPIDYSSLISVTTTYHTPKHDVVPKDRPPSISLFFICILLDKMRLLHMLGATPSTLLLILSSLQVIHALDLPNGLKIETTKPGPICSRKTQNGDVVSMQYRGTLESDGSEFDSNVGGSPFTFKLGQGQVIKGWDQGLVGACIGEERKLTIPSELGYGARGAGSSIPPNSVLSKSSDHPLSSSLANENFSLRNESTRYPRRY